MPTVASSHVRSPATQVPTSDWVTRNVDILSMNTRTSKQGLATMETSFQVSSREELGEIVDKIRNIDSVIDIERTTG